MYDMRIIECSYDPAAQVGWLGCWSWLLALAAAAAACDCRCCGCC